MKRCHIYFLLIVFFVSCNDKPVPESLPLSVKSTLSLLQENPQFVMYMNFKSMRGTNFWKRNISDSLLKDEKTFGSLLNTFKVATGVSINDGLDELYYSNSWMGENAIVLKGVFDRDKLNNYLKEDSMFTVMKYSDGTRVYMKTDNRLYFFFKDKFTLCASNYLKQIDAMMGIKDTTIAGLLANENLMKVIEQTIYKENLWMVTTEKTFIRGVIQNFMEEHSPEISHNEFDTLLYSDTTTIAKDTMENKTSMENLYKRINSISFSAKMNEDLKLIVQCACISEESAKYFKSILDGLIAFARLSTSNKENISTNKVLGNVSLRRFDNDVNIDLNVSDEVLKELRKAQLLNKPE